MKMFVLILSKNFILKKRKSLPSIWIGLYLLKKNQYLLPSKTGAPAPDGFMGEIYQKFKEEMVSIF